MGKLSEKLEQYTLEIIHGRNNGRLDRFYRLFLFSLSHLYRFIVTTRHSLYEQAPLRRFQRQNLGSMVISIGNLTTGGTGKTPVVEHLARRLTEKGRRVAILSRGYRSQKKSISLWQRIVRYFSKEKPQTEMQQPDGGPRVVSNGYQLLLDSLQAGDEPFMLARNLLGNQEEKRNGVMVLVDKNRIISGRYAIDHHCNTLILDDGLQYMPLRPRINIILVDSTSPFSNHEVLPFGLLREPIEYIKSADYIFITKCNKTPENYIHLKRFIQRHNHLAPIILCNHEPRYLSQIDGTGHIPLESLKGKKVAAICGIAVPQSFENYLEQLGATIVYRSRYVDHHRYSPEEIQHFLQKAAHAGADLCITTEKDAVRITMPPSEKIPLDSQRNPLPFLFLRIEIVIKEGQEYLDQCITRISMH